MGCETFIRTKLQYQFHEYLYSPFDYRHTIYQMHLFQVAFYASGIYYALFVDQGLLIPFFTIVAAYLIISTFFIKGAKDISIRKKIMLATWSDPSEGVCTVKVPVRTDKTNKVIESQPKEKRLTLTHFALKAVGELLKTQPDLNGKLVFGKWVPYESVDISCLVDIEGGKDLAIVCIKGIDKMSVEDIANYLKEKAGKMKKSDGGEEHKKKTKPVKFIPAFIVTFLLEFGNFVANKLGISFPPLGLEKHSFGAAVVTSVGMLGFEDAVAPFTGFANCSIFCAVNGSIKAPVVEGDKIVVGEIMNCNFVADHRYIDGGRCKNLMKAFRDVFENPENYLDKEMKKNA